MLKGWNIFFQIALQLQDVVPNILKSKGSSDSPYPNFYSISGVMLKVSIIYLNETAGVEGYFLKQGHLAKYKDETIWCTYALVTREERYSHKYIYRIQYSFSITISSLHIYEYMYIVLWDIKKKNLCINMQWATSSCL